MGHAYLHHNRRRSRLSPGRTCGSGIAKGSHTWSTSGVSWMHWRTSPIWSHCRPVLRSARRFAKQHCRQRTSRPAGTKAVGQPHSRCLSHGRRADRHRRQGNMGDGKVEGTPSCRSPSDGSGSNQHSAPGSVGRQSDARCCSPGITGPFEPSLGALSIPPFRRTDLGVTGNRHRLQRLVCRIGRSAGHATGDTGRTAR